MRVVNVGEVEKESFSSALFTGSDVTRQILLPDSKEYNCNVVNFGKGVRNKFHAHDSEQILIVTAGKGIIATETEQQEITAAILLLYLQTKNTGTAQRRTRSFLTFISRDWERN